MIDKLIAYKEYDVVGVLDRTDTNNYVFRYERSWLESKMPQPLSLLLPLQDSTFSEEASKVFFSNLLPEGQVREYYASKYRISADDDFELLANLAGDCAGAIALYQEDMVPSRGDKQEYRSLSEDDIKKVAEQPYIMELAFLEESKESIRLSLAGAQDKLPIAIITENQISLPLHGAPSTHILKPQNPRFNSLVQNELFCMTLAKEMGLNVPEVTILKLGDEDNYVIKRYDRLEDENGRISRIHQEDFCQATGTSYRYKYEDKGGPGQKECFDVIKKCKKPLLDRIQLVNLVIFNYLICNADCHAKNISLLYNEGVNPNLAPFYDLVCTAAYSNIDRTLAMSIGGEFDPRNIVKESWEEFSRQIGDASPKPTLKTLEKMAKEIPSKAEAVTNDISNRFGASSIYDEIMRNINHRSSSVLRYINR